MYVIWQEGPVGKAGPAWASTKGKRLSGLNERQARTGWFKTPLNKEHLSWAPLPPKSSVKREQAFPEQIPTEVVGGGAMASGQKALLGREGLMPLGSGGQHRSLRLSQGQSGPFQPPAYPHFPLGTCAGALRVRWGRWDQLHALMHKIQKY